MTVVTSSLRAKLTVSFAAVALAFLIAVGVGFTKISSVGSNVENGYGVAVLANAASADAYNMRVSEVQDTLMHQFIKNPDGSLMHPGDIKAFEATLAKLKAASTTSSDKAQLAKIDKLYAAWKAADTKSARLWQNKQYAEAVSYLNGTTNSRGDDLSNALFTFADKAEKAAQASKTSQVHGGQVLMGIFSLLALLAAAAIVWFITKSIATRLAKVGERLDSLSDHCVSNLAGALKAVSQGDLTIGVEPVTTPVGAAGEDEIGRLAKTFDGLLGRVQSAIADYNTMRGQLVDIISEVLKGSTSVASASAQMASTSEEAGRAVGEIANAVGDVAHGAERQVQMVQQAKSSTDESVGVAGAAKAAAEEGISAATKASEAMQAVRDASGAVEAAMTSLSARSEQIGGIVETITGIAGQTNLLALNAAIEAARAGEQGRGFAVVAEEVRKLAEESQQAAASISELIEEIQVETQNAVSVVADGARRSEDGVEVVEQARDAFARIGASVQDVTSRIGEISEAMNEVAAVAEESSASTEEVSASTEQTSASTQEIAASAQELARTAEQLESLVARFRVS
ncbi:MAG TPA: HAMP domain-containing methyl-accepting chemotaxis protein [Gaiellaceae bacterium]|nr:HAMP domain-containing methyl-accepting chemotaxis protein [Gaiellaceae bacterium]